MVHQLISELDSGSKNVMTQKRIITYYMHNHSSTIPDLAKEIDLSIPTVTKFITEMCDAGYLVVTESRRVQKEDRLICTD